MPQIYCLSVRNESMALVVMIILATVSIPCVRASIKDTSSHRVNINPPPVFDKQQYEIKTCLSKDLDEHEKKSCRFYALMIDAGSTGTRLHVFEFSHHTRESAGPFKLEKEIFEEVKPGLSGFAGQPDEAAKSVQKLIEKAKKVVPLNLWAHTPIELKATAGLRLLNENDAADILNAIRVTLSNTPFLTNSQSVAIMSGVDEGIFAWFTLNFLLDRIDEILESPQKLINEVRDNLTGVALDLGGGSTQITFRPLRIDTLTSHYLRDISVFGQSVTIYTHSYLGNGLVAARLETLRLSTRPKNQAAHILYSSCLPETFELEWNYTEKFIVRGSNRYSYERCAEEVSKYVANSQLNQPSEIAHRDIYAFSYFYDRALQSGLVTAEVGGQILIKHYQDAAKKACGKREFGKEHWQPWQCLDLSYIYSLLTDGYGLPPHKEITLTKKLRGMETSWALGASYHLLNTYHEQINSGVSSYKEACYYVCSRLFYGITHLMNYLQLVA